MPLSSVTQQVSNRRARVLRFIGGSAAIIYVMGAAVYLLTHGSWPTPDYLIPPLLLFAVIAGRGWAFLIDWTVFLLLLIIYQSFAGIADDLAARVHFVELIAADRWLVGGRQVPTVLLQDRFFNVDRVMWYDWVATFLHAAHFVVPVSFAFLLWIRSRRTYWRYVLTLMAMFFAGFITYYLYPAAPPWLAAQQDLIPPVARVLFPTLSQFPSSAPLALLYQNFSPNDVAAMPSLHGAAPALIALVSLSLWGWRALPVIVYLLAGGIAFVYLGEHYVIDILAGWLYALGAFLLVWLGLYALGRRFKNAVSTIPVPKTMLVAPRLPGWPLALAALGFIVMIWFNPMLRVPLRPDQEIAKPAVEAPHLKATTVEDLDPQDCLYGTSSSPILDDALRSLATEYGAYLIGLDSNACFSISSDARIPALTAEETALIPSARASQAPTRVYLPEEALGYLTVAQTGLLSEDASWLESGTSGERYAVVIRVNTAEHRTEVEQLVAQVATLVFASDTVSR